MDTFAGSVDTNYVAGKLQVSMMISLRMLHYRQLEVQHDTDTHGGNVITPWGGMPAYTQGMVTRHQFFANTDAWKVAAVYNLKEYGVKAVVYHAEFDIGA